MDRRRISQLAAILVVVAAAAAAVWAWSQRTPSRFFEASEVDRRAYPLRRIDLDAPQPGSVDYYGTLRMAVYIDEKGMVERVELLEATVPNAFREAAVKAFGEARWEPAVRHGRKVKSVKRVEVDFKAPLRELEPKA